MVRIYLIVFPVIVPRLRGATRIAVSCLAAYAIAEVIFAAYYLYLVRQVRSRPVEAKVLDDSRDAMVHQILATDLSSSRSSSDSARGLNRHLPITMFDLGSDSTLAESDGRGAGMSEKSGDPTSITASNPPAIEVLAEKVSQSVPPTASAVEFRERLRTW